ncbi:MAG: MFS transporter, partial [Chloroflexota bacterium]|nr:MFS transporter [Chloroflexota bacterium]
MIRALLQKSEYAIRCLLNSPLVKPRSRHDHNARLLYLNTAMIGVPSGGIMAFLPIFMARLGASSTLIGALSSVPALLAILVFIPAAIIAERRSDHVRVRVTFAKLGRLFYLACALVPFVVPAVHLPLVLVLIWALKTFPDCVSTTAWTSVISRAIPAERRAHLNSIRWALLSIVSALSSAFFGWLLDRVAFPLNYQLVFFVSFAFSWLDPLIFSHIRVPETARRTRGETRGFGARLKEYLRPVVHYKPFLIFAAVTICYRIALNLPTPLFGLFWVEDLAASDTLIGLRGTVGHAALVVGYLFWGRMANRIGHRSLLIAAGMGLALYPIATVLSPSAIWLLPCAAIWGLTASGIDIGLFDLMLAAMPSERQPLFAAIWNMIGNGAVFVGPLLGAILAQSTSRGTTLLIAGLAQMITTIPFVFLPHDA